MDDTDTHLLREIGVIILSNSIHRTVVRDFHHHFRICFSLIKLSDEHSDIEGNSHQFCRLEQARVVCNRENILGYNLVVLLNWRRHVPEVLVLRWLANSVVKHQHNRHVSTEAQLEDLTFLFVHIVRSLIDYSPVQLIEDSSPNVDSWTLGTLQSSQDDLLLDMLEPAELGEHRLQPFVECLNIEMARICLWIRSEVIR